MPINVLRLPFAESTTVFCFYMNSCYVNNVTIVFIVFESFVSLLLRMREWHFVENVTPHCGVVTFVVADVPIFAVALNAALASTEISKSQRHTSHLLCCN